MHCTFTVNAYYGNLYVELGYVAVIGILEFLESAVLDNNGGLYVCILDCSGVYACRAYKALNLAGDFILSEEVVCKP